MFFAEYDSPVGKIIMGSDGEFLTGLRFEGQRSSPEVSAEYRELPLFGVVRKWLDVYFSGECPDLEIPLKLEGSPFQTEVWEILRTIPYGQTMTYGEIARQIAEKSGISRMSAQAVGKAVGRNPVSVIVPCHRVMGSDGSLTGYAGGLDIKRELLKIEGVL